MTQVLSSCKDLGRRFGDLVAVDGVSLEVRAGEVVGLLGANGAGKTTLIRMLLGLLPPSSGEVLLFGAPPSRAGRRRIGYLPQGLGLYDDLTAAENLRFARAVYHARRPAAAPAGASAGPVGSLPLGLQRRVAFAQVLQHEPQLLLLDEPTSGVDPLQRARLWQAVRGAAEAGAGALITTHHMEEAESCDRLIVLARGRVVAEGSLADILGGRLALVVEVEDWPRALALLEAHGLEPALVGRALRLAEGDRREVAKALGDLPYRLRESPVTLEERFVALASAP